MKHLWVLTMVMVGLSVFVQSCVEKKKDDFNRTAMLINIAENVIIPQYQQADAAVSALQNAALAFNANPDAQKLDSLKAAFNAAYKSYMGVEAYDFSASQDMRGLLNNFPPDTNQINNNAATGSYDLNTANNLRAKGFPALDYLLYGHGSAEVVNNFSSPTYKQYLADIVSEIKSKTNTAVSEWTGNYKNTFINASGTDIGSSTGQLVNDISFAAERCRRERVGNSLGYVGLVSGGNIAPQLLEAFYSNQSKELLIEQLQQLKKLYEGNGGIGPDDYLEQVGADYNGTPLHTEISNQFDKAIQAAHTVPVAYTAALSSHKPEMEALFLELKKLVVLLKVDMSSNLGVIITYSDNDGD